MQMQMRNTVSRPALAGRRTTVRAYAAAAGKTQGGIKVASNKPDSRTTQGVQDYLRTLPGWGKGSGPFEDVWDPANLSAGASLADVRRWRESEITHGRVAMLAAVGFIVGEQLKDYPAFFNFDGHITGQAIHQFDQVQQGFWEPLLVAIGLAESYRVSLGWAPPAGGDGFNALKEDYNQGDLNFDPLNLLPTDEDEVWSLKTKELNNGRLAMIGIAGFVLQEVAEPGVEIFQHWFKDIQTEVVDEVSSLKRSAAV